MPFPHFRQANVSRVYRRPQNEDATDVQSGSSCVDKEPTCQLPDASFPGPSGYVKKDKIPIFNPVELIKHEHGKDEKGTDKDAENEKMEECETDNGVKMEIDSTKSDIPETTTASTSESSVTYCTSQESLERRLKIEDEVTFVS